MSYNYFDGQQSPDEIRERMKGFSSWLEIDLDNLGYNLEQIREHVGVTVMAVVKNNAYGHGLIPVTAYLEEQGVEWCMVAKLYEALKIREAGLKLKVLNMDVLFTPEQYRAVVEKGITQCVYTREDADKLNEAAKDLGMKVDVFIKVDTGLNRIGVRHTEAADYIEYVHKLEHVDVAGIFSTFQQNQEDKHMLAKLVAVDGELKERDI